MLKKLLPALILSFALLVLHVMPAEAACPEGTICVSGCEAVGQCVNNITCTRQGPNTIAPGREACGSAQLGGVKPPGAVYEFNILGTGNAEGIGIIAFLSKLLNLFFIICGLWTLFNFLYAGWLLVSAQADTKAQSEVKERLTMTVIGLVIISSAFIGAGLIGLVFFEDASFILEPTLRSALDG